MKSFRVPLLGLLLVSHAAAEHWPLDSGDGGLVVHGVANTIAGAAGRGLQLDPGTVLELRDSAVLNGGDEGFTFSVWVNPHDLHRGQQLIAGKNRYSRGERQWGLMIEADGSLQAYVQQDGWSTIACPEALHEGRWHYVALTLGKQEAALYFNGKRAGQVAISKPAPATATPITLGGTLEEGRLRQWLDGAVDEARFEARALNAEEVAAAYQPVNATHDIVKPLVSEVPLWDEKAKLPKADEMPLLNGVEFSVIKKYEPETDGYQWLHGVGLGWHKGKLYASFGHNTGAENTPTEEARGRVSSDGGRTWSDVFTIDSGAEAPDLAISHGVFISQGGELWAFHGAFYERMGRIHTRAYLLDEASGRWQPKGIIAEDGFWALNLPVRMDDGNWMMPGIKAKRYSTTEAHAAAVAISRGDGLLKWDMVPIPPAPGMKLWGESGVMLDGANVMSVARYGPKALALMATSRDHGRTWTTMAESNLPMATSKPCPGVLSNGQRFLIGTTAANNGGRRAPLTIAMSRPGEKVFSKVFCIRHAVFPEGPGESDERAGLAYPCAVEHEEKLYVGYSNSGGRGGNRNSAELAVIPIASLKVE